MPDSQLQAPQFCQSPQSPDGRITRIGFLFQIVQHLVTVIRSSWESP